MNRQISKSLSFVIFILFLVSMNHWIGWHYRSLFSIIGGLTMVLMLFQQRIRLNLSKRNLIASILLYLGYMIGMLNWKGNLLHTAFFTQIFAFGIPMFVMVCLKKGDKYLLFQRITKWFAWMMLFSIILFIITKLIQLPSLGTTRWTNEEFANKGYGVCYNYFFYLKPLYLDGIERFRGPFLEPGHLGMMCAFILFANKHNYSIKYNQIILVSLVLSLSLAGWILGTIGYFMTRYYQGKTKPIQLAGYLFFCATLIGFAKFYNGGDNIVNEKILSRLEADEENGIVGDNRNSLYTDYLFAEMWNDPSLLFNGYSSTFIENSGGIFDKVSGTGIVKFIVTHGLIGLIAAFSFYFYYSMTANNRKIANLAFFYFILMFFQRCYFSWYSWIICYMIIIDCFDCYKPKQLKYEQSTC